MSLVAYGSSDESSNEEENNSDTKNGNKITPKIIDLQISDKLHLPIPKHTFVREDNERAISTEITKTNELSEKIHFDKLPKPRTFISETKNIVEVDDIPMKKEITSEKPIKKHRAPVKITVPSLSEFADVTKENEFKSNKVKPSSKGTKLFMLLPPPKGTEIKSTNNLVPRVVDIATTESNRMKVQSTKDTCTKDSKVSKPKEPVAIKSPINETYESNSEDEDDTVRSSNSNSITDFFSLTASDTISIPTLPSSDSLNAETNSNNFDSKSNNNSSRDSNLSNYLINNSDESVMETCVNKSQKTLVSNIMNLPKEEILLKNKTEVGPKLPVPEQEYNVDTEGNVAFDDKAIEYLCGKRGVKRKPKEIEEVNIIEINGEDIKPDEREWLVKALTEEPIQRPISMQGGGVSSQSKKKHQITYLAHQAKAMEMELKNQWAQNRLTRKQTQSKYGF